MRREVERETTPCNPCPTCGAANPKAEDFCPNCGKPLVTCVCPSCFAENPPRTHSCQSCYRPLDYIAFIDPIRGIQASAWLVGEINRKAKKGRISTLLKWGVIMGFGPICVLCAAATIGGLVERICRGDVNLVMEIAGIPVAIAVACYSIVFLNVLHAKRYQNTDTESEATT